MKKQILFFGSLIFLMVMSLQSYAQSEVSVTVGQDGLKSPSKARSIALTNTLMPIASGVGSVALFENNTIETVGAYLAVYGLVVGPATGNFYAEDYGRGFAGIGVRAIGAYLMVDATSEIFGHEFANSLHVDDREVSLTDTKILIGAGLILGGIAYNVLSAKASVEEYNNSFSSFDFNVGSAIINNKVAPMLTASFNL